MDFLKKHSSTIISVLATIVVGYLGVIWSQSQFKKAEFERRDRAKTELVEIIEEHVINQKPISPARLSRLIDIKCYEQEIADEFIPIELIKSAESNLMESRHLDFKQKENYKILFDSIYLTFIPTVVSQLNSDSTSFAFKNPELISKLYKNINDCKTSEATKNLKELISSFSIEYKTISEEAAERKSGRSISSIVHLFNTTSGRVLLVSFMLIYILMMLRTIKGSLRARNDALEKIKQSELMLKDLMIKEQEEKDLLKKIDKKTDDITKDKACA
ncbi:MAG: hypothetical protein IPL98_09665 [Saprospiraceae bacterium]|nr:hypothetical protein [Saprospiraceae bacterium]